MYGMHLNPRMEPQSLLPLGGSENGYLGGTEPSAEARAKARCKVTAIKLW